MAETVDLLVNLKIGNSGDLAKLEKTLDKVSGSVGSLTGLFAGVSDQVKKTGKVVQVVTGKADKDIDDVRKRVRNMRTDINSLRKLKYIIDPKALDSAEKGAIRAEKALEEYNDTVRHFGESSEEATASLNELESAQRSASLAALQAEKSFDKMSESVKAFVADAAEYIADAEDFAKAMRMEGFDTSSIDSFNKSLEEEKQILDKIAKGTRTEALKEMRRLKAVRSEREKIVKKRHEEIKAAKAYNALKDPKQRADAFAAIRKGLEPLMKQKLVEKSGLGGMVNFASKASESLKEIGSAKGGSVGDLVSGLGSVVGQLGVVAEGAAVVVGAFTAVIGVVFALIAGLDFLSSFWREIRKAQIDTYRSTKGIGPGWEEMTNDMTRGTNRLAQEFLLSGEEATEYSKAITAAGMRIEDAFKDAGDADKVTQFLTPLSLVTGAVKGLGMSAGEATELVTRLETTLGRSAESAKLATFGIKIFADRSQINLDVFSDMVLKASESTEFFGGTVEQSTNLIYLLSRAGFKSGSMMQKMGQAVTGSLQNMSTQQAASFYAMTKMTGGMGKLSESMTSAQKEAEQRFVQDLSQEKNINLIGGSSRVAERLKSGDFEGLRNSINSLTGVTEDEKKAMMDRIMTSGRSLIDVSNAVRGMSTGDPYDQSLAIKYMSRADPAMFLKTALPMFQEVLKQQGGNVNRAMEMMVSTGAVNEEGARALQLLSERAGEIGDAQMTQQEIEETLKKGNVDIVSATAAGMSTMEVLKTMAMNKMTEWSEIFSDIQGNVQKLTLLVGGPAGPTGTTAEEAAAGVSTTRSGQDFGVSSEAMQRTDAKGETARRLHRQIADARRANNQAEVDRLQAEARSENIASSGQGAYASSASTPTSYAPTGSSADNVHGYASGTSFAPGGLSLVGERGPELLKIPRGSQIIPNNILSGLGDIGGSGEATYNIIVNAGSVNDPKILANMIRTEMQKKEKATKDREKKAV